MKEWLYLLLYDFVMEIILLLEMVWFVITIFICLCLFAYEGVGKLFTRVIGVVIVVSTFCLAYIIPGWIGAKMAIEISGWVKLGYAIIPCIYLIIVVYCFKNKDK